MLCNDQIAAPHSARSDDTITWQKDRRQFKGFFSVKAPRSCPSLKPVAWSSG